MNATLDGFGACEICDTRDWRAIYEGAVRDGAFGRVRENATVGACGGCGGHRLDAIDCLSVRPEMS